MAAPSPLLRELIDLTREARKVALDERTRMVRELKPDGSIVTNVDRAVETYLRRVLPDLVPGSTVWGEEFGFEPEGSEGLWLVDPVDGTSNFAFGSPLWGISVALVRRGEVLTGVIDLPDLDELYSAEKGAGAWVNEELLAPIPAGPIRDEELVSYAERILLRFGSARLPGKMRCTGAFVVEGAFVARQRYRGMLGQGEHLYDVAASVLINQELGADVRYANGDPFDVAALCHPTPIPGAWITFPAGTDFRL